MDRDQPEYLAKLPKDRHGMWMMFVLALVLAFTFYGAWKLYLGTVEGWERRYGEGRPAPTPDTVYTRAAPAVEVDSYPAPTPIKIDKCINGTAFRKLPDGGWENIPNMPCP